MNRIIVFLWVGIVVLGFGSVGGASTITFETYRSGFTPKAGYAITDQFEDSHGVTFSLANGGAPVLVKYGGPPWAFFRRPVNRGVDGFVPSEEVGEFFLRDNRRLGFTSDLILTYINNVSAASGAILDIDNSEVWTINAFDIAGNHIDAVVLSYLDSNSGDGVATYWSFDHGKTADIHSIVLHGERTLPGYPDRLFGFAFDNFSSTSLPVPIPSAAFLLASGIIGLVGVRRIKE